MPNNVEQTLSRMTRNRGIDPQGLVKELRRQTVQKMSLKDRVEYINRLKFPFGVVRCTPNLLLKKWLGLDMRSVQEVGCSLAEKLTGNDFIYTTALHISHIKNDEVFDFGFFVSVEEGDDFIDNVIEEGVIDLSMGVVPYTVGVGPKSFEKFEPQIVPLN